MRWDWRPASAPMRRPTGTVPRVPRRCGRCWPRTGCALSGEPVAAVIAETLAEARDAAELIEVDYDELPAKIDLAPGGEPIHDEVPDNVAFDWGMGDEAAVDAALAASARTVTMVIDDNRIIATAMEPRGCYAEAMADGRLHLCFGGQGVWGEKAKIARIFGIDKEQVRVTHPDVGGGFGMKAAVLSRISGGGGGGPRAEPSGALVCRSQRIGAVRQWRPGGDRHLHPRLRQGQPHHRLQGRCAVGPRRLQLGLCPAYPVRPLGQGDDGHL